MMLFEIILKDANEAGRSVIIGAFSEGSGERLLGILKTHNILVSTDPKSLIRLAVLKLEMWVYSARIRVNN